MRRLVVSAWIVIFSAVLLAQGAGGALAGVVTGHTGARPAGEADPLGRLPGKRGSPSGTAGAAAVGGRGPERTRRQRLQGRSPSAMSAAGPADARLHRTIHGEDRPDSRSSGRVVRG